MQTALQSEHAAKLDLAKFIVAKISGELGISVRLGQAGKGSFYDCEKPEIVLDPNHLEQNAIAVSAHEASHRFWTPTLLEMRANQVDLSWFENIGMSALLNVLEDQAINNSAVRKYDGLKSEYEKLYKDFLEERQGGYGIIHPEVEEFAKRLGYLPMFARGLYELLRDWACQRAELGYEKNLHSESPTVKISSGVPDVIADFARESSSAVRLISERVAPTEEVNRQVLAQYGSRRVTLTHELVYPRLKKLVDLDIKNVASALAGQKALQDSSLEKTLGNALDKAQGEFIEGQVAGDLEEIKDLLKKASEGDSEAKDKLDKKLKELGLDSKDLDEEKLEAKLREKIKSEIDAGEKISIDPAKLSTEEKQALEELFSKLSPEEQKKMLEQARRILEHFEDGLTKALDGKLIKDKISNHQERREAKLRAKKRADERLAEIARLKQEFDSSRAQLDAQRTPYEKVLAAVNPLVAKMEHELRRILEPNELLTWQRNQDHGPRVNTLTAMRSKADPELRLKLFDRRNTPTERSYAFSVLCDVSGSMKESGKAVATQSSAVLLDQLFSRLQIAYEIYAFNDNPHLLKSYDELSTARVRDKIMSISAPTGSTNDAQAISTASKSIGQQQSDFKVIIVISDAQSGASNELKQAITNAKNKGIVVVHFGLGAGTKDTQNLYSHSWGNLQVGAEVSSENNFQSVFCRVIGDIVRDPQRFLEEVS